MAHEDAARSSTDSDQNPHSPVTHELPSTSPASKNITARRESIDSQSLESRRSMDGAKENNEFSPLLSPQNEGVGPRFASVVSPLTDEHWEGVQQGTTGEESKSSWYLLLLTLTIGG